MSGERKIRVLVAKPGLDGHDVGAKIVARALMHAGFEVIYTGLRKSPEQIVRTACDEDVDVIGLSILSGAHLSICRRMQALFVEAEAKDFLWLIGGNIPKKDGACLKELGVDAVFAVGTPLDSIVTFIREKMRLPILERSPDFSSLPEKEGLDFSSPLAKGGLRGVLRSPKNLPQPLLEKEGSKKPNGLPAKGTMTSEEASGLAPLYNESGLEIKPLYTAEDVEASGGSAGVGQPGEYPFTRGIHREMYRKRPWTMRQYAGFGTPEETNERFRYLIANGQTGLNVAFDLPTQIGLDSSDPAAQGEVGRVGMAVDTLRDMEIAFEGIDLEKITVSLTVNGSAAILMAMYFALAKKRGYDLARLRGTAQNDILKEFIGRGTWIFPVEPSVQLVGDTILHCAQHVPFYSPVSVCGYHIRESGADPVQEIGYAFCIAKAYIDHVLERGMKIDEFASRLSFNFDIHGNLFEQIAKLRAARRLWARIVKEEYLATNPRSMWMRMIAGGGGGGLTIEQPENNIVRGAYYALISALAGTQTMALCSYDEAYTIPSQKAAQISLRTMQILIEEMGLCDTVDPLGGSYYVETLTNQMEDRIRQVMAKVDSEGGIVQAVSQGQVQNALSRQAYENLRAVQSGAKRKVGVNCYRVEEKGEDVEFHPFNEESCAKQIRRLESIRAERDNPAVNRALQSVLSDANAGRNVMPGLSNAVELYATVGELTHCLAEAFGRYQEPVHL